MWRKFFIVQGLLVLGILAYSQTVLPDSIKVNTVLNAEDSPYYLNQRCVILVNTTLEVDAGVQFIISNGVSILNHGRMIIKGTKKNPVLFTTASDSLRWKYIDNGGSIFASYLFIRNATRFIASHGDTIVVKNCDVDNTFGTIGDDCIGVHNAKKVLVLNSVFKGNPDSGKTDALDIDAVSDDTISGNTISYFSDDGIDIGTGSPNMVVTDNSISYCDMGISVGEQSTAKIRGNLLVHCVAGIQSHYGSIVTAQQNTLYGNIQGLRAFHNSNEETSGGTIYISNSIISNCVKILIAVKDGSIVTLDYCLTDSIFSSGTGNIYGDAAFSDIEADDFRLKRNSPAIDAGDPAAGFDPDGTRIDMGCFPYFQSSLKIIEISPSNLSLVSDDFGAFTDWFKIYNESETNINLNHYFLSDNKDNPQKYQLSDDLFVKAGDTITFWADNLNAPLPYHVPFKLSGEGEYLSISNPVGILLDEKTFSRVPINFIYTRVGLTEDWVYSEWPVNDTSESFLGLCSSPIYSNPGGASSFPLEVGLSTTTGPDPVYYSLDGSDPSKGMLYENIISIGEPLTLRTIVQKENYLPTYVHAASYFPANSYHLPLMSLSTNTENLYGSKGIYEHFRSASNLWERPASVSYYDGDKSFSAITGIKIQGGNSVWMPKKSFRFHFRGGYGASRLNASPFNEGPPSFKNLVIRAGYDDDISNLDGTMLRDPFSTDLWGKLGELATQSSWSVLLLNNDYWGIYNVRESINEYFVMDHLGIEDFDLVRFQKDGPDLKYGTWDEWNKLVAYFQTSDFSKAETYDELSSFMDMNSLLNLLAFVHVTQFRSWTWGAFVAKPVSGKWRWTIWDTDRSFNEIEWNGFTEYANTSAEKWPNFIPQKLLLNERFKNELINRNCDLLNSILLPEKAISVYDSLVSILTPEMDAEYTRWSPGNRSRWETNNESVRVFLRNRPSSIYTQMKAYFTLEDTSHLSVQIVGKGSVKLNSLLIEQPKWKGVYMKGVPVSLTAIPDPGSSFIEWRDVSGAHVLTIQPENYSNLVAVFDTTSALQREKLVINEIMYNPHLSENSEWIELFNPNDFGVSLEDFVLTDGGLGNKFIFPSGTMIDPQDYLIVAGDLNMYGSEFGMEKTVNGSFNASLNGFNLSNAGETIYLMDAFGEMEDQVDYDDSGLWSVWADGIGPSLQLKSPDLDNHLPENWFADTEILYTPGAQNRMYNSSPALVEEFSVKCYPNPVKEMLYIEIPLAIESDISAKIYTLSGSEVVTETFTQGANQGVISWQHGLRYTGMYILKISWLQSSERIESTQLLIYSGR